MVIGVPKVGTFAIRELDPKIVPVPWCLSARKGVELYVTMTRAPIWLVKSAVSYGVFVFDIRSNT